MLRLIERQDFIDAINSMMIIDDYQNDKNKLYKKYQADGFLIEPDNNGTILKLLKLLLPSDIHYKLLEDFCLTNNYGRGKGNNVLTDIDGQRLYISSPGALYDHIFSDKEGDDEVLANME